MKKIKIAPTLTAVALSIALLAIAAFADDPGDSGERAVTQSTNGNNTVRLDSYNASDTANHPSVDSGGGTEPDTGTDANSNADDIGVTIFKKENKQEKKYEISVSQAEKNTQDSVSQMESGELIEKTVTGSVEEESASEASQATEQSKVETQQQEEQQEQEQRVEQQEEQEEIFSLVKEAEEQRKEEVSVASKPEKSQQESEKRDESAAEVPVRPDPGMEEKSLPSAITTCVVRTVDGAIAVRGCPDYQQAKMALDEVNREREQAGIEPLEWDDCLAASALERAFETAVQFSHTRPDGSEWYTAHSRGNGENLARGQEDAQTVTGAWMNAQGHRANILQENFSKVGIACVQTDDGTYWVQLFGM